MIYHRHMKARIYVNRHVVRQNEKTGQHAPPICIRTYKGVRRVHKIVIKGPSVMYYSPDKPLPCGARVWLETEI